MTAADLPSVLVVDDEAPIRLFLRSSLEAKGYRVAESDSLTSARLQVAAQAPGIVLLDLALPDGDGVEFVRELRIWSSTPIVVLSARGTEQDKVAALDAGADDYLTKPFGVSELLARLRAAVRRIASSAGKDPVRVEVHDSDGNGFSLDFGTRRCQRRSPGGAIDVALTPTEFRLLATMMKHAGKVMTHAQILREVWGPRHEQDVAYLRVYLGQLRQKLEPLPARPRWLLTEPGVGYRLDPRRPD